MNILDPFRRVEGDRLCGRVFAPAFLAGF
jgi:hypothetical protein